jgi:hypothetical protein
MRRPAVHIVIILLLLFGNIRACFAQNRNKLIIAQDRLVLQIDLKSTNNELDSAFKIAGISRVDPELVKKGDFAAIVNDGWDIGPRKDDRIEFDRSLTGLSYDAQRAPYMITTRLPNIEGKWGYPAPVKYGINKYGKITVYELSSGLTRFILPGYESAKRVFLSGSFNNWSTLNGAMQKADGGWMIDIKLNPGAYEYKYIADGRWITDPNDQQKVDDGGGHVNSVYFKYNYTFKLAGYPSAQRITVAGDFNNWDANELIMERKNGVWERPMYIADGKYYYRFMVDGQWTTDPANHLKIKEKKIDKGEEDKYSYLNSVLNLGEKVVFKLPGYADAKKVVLSGGFDTQDTVFAKKGGAWTLPIILAAGNYNYRFSVDDNTITDPQNPYYSTVNGEKWSFLAVKPNHTFVLKGHDNAKKVTLCGVFNEWQPDGYTMEHKNGEWSISFHLKPGKYLYKFRVDGDWIIDPGNKLWEQNEEHTGNSVLWIE